MKTGTLKREILFKTTKKNGRTQEEVIPKGVTLNYTIRSDGIVLLRWKGQEIATIDYELF